MHYRSNTLVNSFSNLIDLAHKFQRNEALNMAKIKKTLQEQEDILIQQKAKLDKKLKAVQNKLYEKKLTEISELVFKYKLYEYDLEILDAAFEKMSLDLKEKS